MASPNPPFLIIPCPIFCLMVKDEESHVQHLRSISEPPSQQPWVFQCNFLSSPCKSPCLLDLLSKVRKCVALHPVPGCSLGFWRADPLPWECIFLSHSSPSQFCRNINFSLAGRLEKLSSSKDSEPGPPELLS